MLYLVLKDLEVILLQTGNKSILGSVTVALTRTRSTSTLTEGVLFAAACEFGDVGASCAKNRQTITRQKTAAIDGKTTENRVGSKIAFPHGRTPRKVQDDLLGNALCFWAAIKRAKRKLKIQLYPLVWMSQLRAEAKTESFQGLRRENRQQESSCQSPQRFLRRQEIETSGISDVLPFSSSRLVSYGSQTTSARFLISYLGHWLPIECSVKLF